MLFVSIDLIAQPVINTITGTTSRCAKTGSLTVSTTGGASPLQFSLVSPSKETRPAQTSNVFAALAPGKYFIRVVDANSAFDTASFTVTGSYQLPSFKHSKKSPSCSKSNGSFAIDKISGGLGPFQYKIVNGPQTTGWQNSNVFTAKPKGTYTVAIIDSCGNTRNLSVTLNDTTFTALSINRNSSRNHPSSCDSFSMYFYANYGLGPLRYRIINGTDTIKFSKNSYINLKKGTNYKYQVVDACDNARDIAITENKYIYFTSSFRCNGFDIDINPYYYNTPFTSTCMKFGVVNKSNNVAVWQKSRRFTLDSGVTYILYAIDTCCNDTFKQERNFVNTGNLSVYKNYVTNLDSTTGLIIYNYSTTYPYHTILLNSPFSNTDSFTTTTDQYKQGKFKYNFNSGDTIGFNNNQYSFLNNVPKGKYTFMVVDTCGNSDTLEVEVLESDLWKKRIRTKVITGCPSGHQIAFSVENSGPYKPTFYYKQLSPSSSTTNFSSKIQNPVIYDTIKSVNAGTYVFELYNPWGGTFFTGGGAAYIRDTVIVKDPGYPLLEFPVTYTCNDGSSSIITKANGGLEPYSYRIQKVGSSTWSSTQNIGEFHGLTTGLYKIEVTDSCGNTNVTTSSSSYLTAPKINLGFSCDNDSLQLFVNEIYGVKYRWYKGNNVISNNRVHDFKPYSPSNYGDYRLQVYVSTSNGLCVDTFTSITLGKNIQLQGPYLWGCNSIKFNKSWIYENGIYSDTTTSVGGCDSVMTHKIVLGKNETIEKDTQTCDSLYILNQWITKDSTIYDTIAGEGFNRDTIAGNDFEGGKNGFASSVQWDTSSVDSKSGDKSIVNTNRILSLPALDNPAELEFYYISQIGYFVTLHVEFDTGSGWKNIETINFGGHSTQTWKKTSYDLFYLSGKKNVKFRIRGFSQLGGYILLDDVYSRAARVDCDSIIKYDIQVKKSSYTYRSETQCDSALINSNWYSSSGLVKDTLVNAVGCDSFVHTSLTINNTVRTSQNITYCDSGLVQGEMFKTTQTILDTLQTYLKCDSIITTSLTINYTKRTADTITYCDSGLVQGEMYYSTQLVNDTLTSYLNCDSIITTALTINLTKRTYDTLAYCDSGLVQGTVYYTSQEVQDTFNSYLNCDSIVITDLTVNYTKRTYDTITYCDSGLVQNTMYYFTQEVQDTFTSYRNCDSIVITDLTVNYTQRTYDTLTYCDSGLVQGNVYSSSQEVLDTFYTSENCDSIIITDLTVNYVQRTYDTITYCDSGDVQGTIYYSSQEVQDTFTSYLNCDSIIITDLTVNYTQKTFDTFTYCDSGVVQGSMYYSTQEIQDTFTSYLDCDSIVITDLTVNYTKRTYDTLTYCDSGLVQGTMYYSSQEVQDTFTTYLNCDSIVITDLTVNYTQVTNLSNTSCDSALIHGNWYYNTQEVRDTFTTYLNCDSIVVTDLIVNYTQVTPVYTTVCDSGLVHGIMYYNSQLIKDSFTSYLNCDSVVHTYLTVNPVKRTYESQTNCDSGLVQGKWYSSTQVVNDTFSTYLNCDSIVITDLTVNYTQVTNLVNTSCDSAIIHGTWYYATQEVRDTFTTYLNCDSVVVTSLTVNSSKFTNTNASVCDSMSINGNWYFASQLVIDTLSTHFNCDSIVHTVLKVRNSFVSRYKDTFCRYYNYELDDGTIVNQPGIYQSIYNSVQDCDSIIEVNLIEKDCSPCTIFFPNAFTANLDGLNDGFSSSGTCTFNKYQLSIYNRWGELLFYTEDPDASWDGTFMGELVPAGVYFYSCYYINNEDKVANIHGDITVLK